jgi:hypothetical protein
MTLLTIAFCAFLAGWCASNARRAIKVRRQFKRLDLPPVTRRNIKLVSTEEYDHNSTKNFRKQRNT